MKLLIISAGPGLDDVTSACGEATDWFAGHIKNPNIIISINNIYKNEDFDEAAYDAWIITGSASSVMSKENWIIKLEKKIRYAYKKNIPILGVCFGHQIISSALGGEVIRNEKGWELGSYKLKINKEGQINSIFKDVLIEDYFYFSHQDIVTKIPSEGKELARNNMGLQSFSIGNNIFGVQFHPEFSANIIKKYVEVRLNSGVVFKNNNIYESQSSYNVISNFINIAKEF